MKGVFDDHEKVIRVDEECQTNYASVLKRLRNFQRWVNESSDPRCQFTFLPRIVITSDDDERQLLNINVEQTLSSTQDRVLCVDQGSLSVLRKYLSGDRRHMRTSTSFRVELSESPFFWRDGHFQMEKEEQDDGYSENPLGPLNNYTTNNIMLLGGQGGPVEVFADKVLKCMGDPVRLYTKGDYLILDGSADFMWDIAMDSQSKHRTHPQLFTDKKTGKSYKFPHKESTKSTKSTESAETTEFIESTFPTDSTASSASRKRDYVDLTAGDIAVNLHEALTEVESILTLPQEQKRQKCLAAADRRLISAAGATSATN